MPKTRSKPKFFPFFLNAEIHILGCRPSKAFEECSAVIKHRKTAELRGERSTEELSFATSIKLSESGNTDAARLLTEATTTTPTRASKILKTWITPKQEISSYSTEEAVAQIVSLNLTRAQYVQLRNGSREHGHDIYPPYYKVLEAKKQFYPRSISIPEQKCEVPLQNLLVETCRSIIK
ncbi:molybdopterin cofactor sulfurase mosc [Holotrichia oblita]|uniref:Molybdopterin cofactor sulfurase mosc n=1 Tax=Holotrichia oblita TaxID=644536 RepID=A0ACB9SLG2_HOLOL|nr:molybdopterin cofactor sulfurase mosc [Holotrichia oblita]